MSADLSSIYTMFSSVSNFNTCQIFLSCKLFVSQVDQGLGIGSNFPFFNRHQLTFTKFFQLMEVEEGAGKPPPPVLVLHGHYGGCVGDLPSYDAFTLGGPYSVRGYNMGEIGAARNIVEVGAMLPERRINYLMLFRFNFRLEEKQ